MLPNRHYSPEDLARYRIEKAKMFLHDAQVPDNSLETAASRSYYCIFNAMRAVLTLDRFDSKKHSGIISEFRKNYIKTGIFPQSFSVIITKLFEIRLEGDYETFFLVSKAEVAE
ncbi:hypothetical protein R80B4_01867 [Fibrobacteres bacterium R8-0-B4]